MSDAAGVSASGIRKRFGDGPEVLADVSVAVEPGATLALLGPSGCGKTTLLRILAGLERPDAGTVEVAERVMTGPSEWVPPERRNIGMVFQDWALFPHLSVGRNVGFGLPRSERRASSRIDEALDLVGLADYADRSPSTLSGGQQQRVALARAIAPRPSVLLLDEPFSNLDASLRTRVRTEIHQLLVELGITTIFVTHDQDEAFVLGDSVAVLAEGTVVQAGTPAELYQRPVSRWLADFVGDANFVRAEARGATAATPLGSVPLIGPTDGEVDVLIRPELIGLEAVSSAARQGGLGGVDGVVELVEFLGHSTSYLVRTGSVTLTVRRLSTPVAQRGDSVRLTYRGDHAAWFEPTDAPG